MHLQWHAPQLCISLKRQRCAGLHDIEALMNQIGAEKCVSAVIVPFYAAKQRAKPNGMNIAFHLSNTDKGLLDPLQFSSIPGGHNVN